MFELVKLDNPPEYSSIWTGRVMYGDRCVCKLDTWGFSSCAVRNLHDFDTYNLKHAGIDKFFDWLGDLLAGSYVIRDAYFLLSDSQLTNMPDIKKVKGVKKVDSFTNKSHGPNDVHLFRWTKGE